MTSSKVTLDVAEIDDTKHTQKHISLSKLTTSSVMFLKGKCYKWGAKRNKSGYTKQKHQIF